MGYSTTFIKNGKVEKVGNGGLVPKGNFPPGDYEGQIIQRIYLSITKGVNHLFQIRSMMN